MQIWQNVNSCEISVISVWWLHVIFVMICIFVCLKQFTIFIFNIFYDCGITVVTTFLTLYLPLQQSLPLVHMQSGSPCVMHISSLASLIPTLLLTSSSLFCTYQLCFLIPAPFSPTPAPHSPSHSQLLTLQMISTSMTLFLFCLSAQFVFVFQIQLLIVVNLLPFNNAHRFDLLFLNKFL